jgi:hypothetical protein
MAVTIVESSFIQLSQPTLTPSLRLQQLPRVFGMNGWNVSGTTQTSMPTLCLLESTFVKFRMTPVAAKQAMG